MLKKSLTLLALAAACCAARAAAAERLRGEPSAFLRSYVDSPVDWMPWGAPAFARAEAEQKPVFLFIGSFTSELAGAMRRQTFANARNADWLNKGFVCVIVDRDERPDVAALYQAYVTNLKQISGWPLNLWLTPEFQPFEGATYLSPSEDWGAPGFLKLANQAKAAWAADPKSCRRRAAEAAAQMAPPAQAAMPAWNAERTRARLAAAAAAWQATFDPVQGGFGDSPKAPEPEVVRFMLLQSDANRDAARRTLRAIAASALRDPLDGGFFRHAADAAWRIPYPQKTLSDQARIALAYLDAAQGADAAAFGRCARGALDFALGHLANADGTFASAVDATGDEFSGYYAWTEAEIAGVLGPAAPAFEAAHGALAGGNVPADDDPSSVFAGKNLLRSSPGEDADGDAARRLLAARARRAAPPRDLRATAGAHGLILSALARAGSELGDPRYTEAARRTLAAVRRAFVDSPDGSLRRLAGSPIPAAAEDYAALALGCRDLARAAHDRDAAALAESLLARLDALYYGPSVGGYFGAPNPPGPGFFVRPAASEEPPCAVALAILAAGPHAASLAALLSESLDESSPQAPGDQLLALASFAAASPRQ